jgi:hypothetical protein
MSDRRERDVSAGVPAVRTVPYPRFQEQTIDWLELAQRRHAMQALIELDITAARAAIRDARRRTGEPLGFTAYLVACLARSVAADRRIAALRHGRRRLMVFRDVDVAMPVESDVESEAIPVPHIIRRADQKSLTRLSREIAGAASGPVPYAVGRRALGIWLLLPAWMRRRAMAMILADARRRRRLTGTVMVTVVALPGSGRAWGLPNGTNYPISLVVGGVRRGADGRESVALTLSFDHDTVNGAPAARFVRRFARLVESAALLDDI